jgi:two-component system KDP operon response regulator KdpE
MSDTVREAPGAEILVIEDDEEARAVLARDLRLSGYRVVVAEDARTGLQRFAARRPAAILLDLTLPDLDGLDVIRRIRREAATPIVVLSARFDERDKVAALDRGADDYLTKPFGVGELHARIRLALRHAGGPAADRQGRLQAGPIELDPDRHAVNVAGRPVELTPREFEILRVLLAHQGRIVTKGRLLRLVWGASYQDEDAYVYVHVSSVRRKLNAADPTAEAGSQIVTEPGVGYRMRTQQGESF